MRRIHPFRRGRPAGALSLAGALLLTTACAPVATSRDAAGRATPATAATPGTATFRASETSPPLPAFLADTVAAIRADFAPDRRVARFDVEAGWAEGGARLDVTGATDQPAALARLDRALSAHGVAWENRVRQLPDSAVGETGWALVNNSVANLRSEPRHAAELATQAPLGTPLRVVDRDGGWLLVQVPDRYLAWVDAGGVHRVALADIEAHRGADRVIYLEPAGVARSAPRTDASPVSDLVAGAMLFRLGAADGFHHVRFPDGREAYVAEGESARYAEWAGAVRATEASVVASAMTLLGRPYLWGGTSANGMDCSGFTKTVFLLNGLILPRDASQQIHAGTLVDDARHFETLRPGDLLFFGRPATATTPERVIHVGMWIGGGRFIHSSGRVQVNSVDPTDPLYDAFNTGRYLRTKRMLDDAPGVHRLADDALYPTRGRFPPTATSGPAAR
jgi:gamma-D-glutamyl-L-lysine dipeptidyl-peptidase